MMEWEFLHICRGPAIICSYLMVEKCYHGFCASLEEMQPSRMYWPYERWWWKPGLVLLWVGTQKMRCKFRGINVANGTSMEEIVSTSYLQIWNIDVVSESVCCDVCELWAPQRSRDAPHPSQCANLGFAQNGCTFWRSCLIVSWASQMDDADFVLLLKSRDGSWCPLLCVSMWQSIMSMSLLPSLL